MNGQQKAVLWIGLILVTLNLAKRWPDIRGIIFSGAGGVSSSNPASGGISVVPGIGAPSSGGVTLPFGGFPITVPVGVVPNIFSNAPKLGNTGSLGPSGTVVK
jgi:hypothetical protein